MNVRELINKLMDYDGNLPLEIMSQYGDGCSLCIVMRPATWRDSGEYVEILTE